MWNMKRKCCISIRYYHKKCILFFCFKVLYLQSLDGKKREAKYKVWNIIFLRSKKFFCCSLKLQFQKPFTSICAIFANNKCQNYSKLKFNFSFFSLLVVLPFLCLNFLWVKLFFIGCCELLSKKLKLFSKWIKRKKKRKGKEKTLHSISLERKLLE